MVRKALCAEERKESKEKGKQKSIDYRTLPGVSAALNQDSYIRSPTK